MYQYENRKSKMTFAEARDFCRLEEDRDLASFDSADSLNYVLSNC